ncbi:site-specific integrase [Sulfurovum sp. TSL1]|uniref:tyrosine-type recombinase/integrase n=1 Tax=Sulfurovum sp. TSL1 TaxID=2826994 RepID=UPI001CC5E8DB|nr:site-specific integrase [Sulfurovum sp. TSL1]
MKNYSLEGIDLKKRLQKGMILHLHEIESLCDTCKLPLKEICADIAVPQKSKQSINTRSLEKFRSTTSKKQIITISSDATGNRIRVIRNFLVWMANIHMAKLPEQDMRFMLLKDAKDFLESTLNSRIPGTSHNSSENAPMGLSEEAIAKLFEVIDRGSPYNPWTNNFTKIRNELLILWLYQFGIRRSELLGLKISDLDFRSETFNIVRRPDDPEDPRLNQPTQKTHGRKIAMPKKIVRLTLDYITKHRTVLAKANKHEFLFVASKTGAAMSLDTVNKVFSKLKKTYPDIFANLTPHILRHTWNDNFSALMDERNESEAKEQKMRSYLMGWDETSGSAETYTKRHVQRKANESILEMDNNFPQEEDLPDWAKE